MDTILFRHWLPIIAAACSLNVGHLDAQTAAPRDTTHRPGKPLFTLDDALLGVGFAGVTVAMFPVDESVARHLRSPSAPTNRFINRAATGFEIMAEPGSLVIGSAIYLYGRFAHHPDLEDLGWHSTEAVIVGSSITVVLKGLAGRSRPYVSDATNPRDFKFAKGFRSSARQSFPSGHATAAFAAASAVTSEVRRMWPAYTWYAGPLMYGGATMVGLARMYHNKHWASDVALGAAIGTFSGLKIVRYSHTHPDNRVDRWMLKAMIQPDGHGGALAGVSVPWSP